MSDLAFCPNCFVEYAPGTSACTICGLLLQEPEMPRLREVWHERKALDAEWFELSARWQERLRQATAPLFKAAPTYTPAYTARPTAPKKEWTPKRVQNVLLTLGAILCALAALSFVAVSWQHIGVNGRAAIMVIVTLLTAAGGQVAMSRRLKSTAEAVTGIAYALLLIDLVSARSLNLLDLQSVPWWQFWTPALIAMSALGVIHRSLSRIDSPVYIAFGVAQLPIAFMLGGSDAGLTFWVIGLGVQAVCAALIGNAVTEHRDLPGLSDLAFAVAGLVTAGVAVVAGGNVIAKLASAQEALPLIAVAITFIAVAYAGGTRTKSLQLFSFTAATIAVTLDAVSAVIYNASQTNWALSIVAIGAVVAVVACAARFTKIPGLLTVAVITVGGGLLLTLPAFALILSGLAMWTSQPWSLGSVDSWAYLMHTNSSQFSLSVLAAVGSAAAVFAGISAWPQQAKDVERTSRLAAIVTALVAADLIPFVLDLPYAGAVAVVTMLAIGTLLAAQFVARRQNSRSALYVLGAVFVSQAVVSSLASNVATLIVLATFTVLATGIAAADRKALTVAGSFATLFGLAWVGALSGSAGFTAVQTGLVLVVFGQAVMTSFALSNMKMFASIVYSAVAVTSVGFVLVFGDGDLLSIALAICVASTATLATYYQRADFGWTASGFMLALIWLRLGLSDVQVVEAYTLPLAGLALFAGYVVAWRTTTPVTSTQAFGWGLALAFAPSLVQLAGDTVSLRALLVLIASMATIFVGASYRMKAPITAGAIALLLTVLTTEGQYLMEIPRWIAIGVAGVALVGVGATWEARRRDLKAATALFARLG